MSTKEASSSSADSAAEWIDPSKISWDAFLEKVKDRARTASEGSDPDLYLHAFTDTLTDAVNANYSLDEETGEGKNIL